MHDGSSSEGQSTENHSLSESGTQQSLAECAVLQSMDYLSARSSLQLKQKEKAQGVSSFLFPLFLQTAGRYSHSGFLSCLHEETPCSRF